MSRSIRAYFISDVHVKSEDSSRGEALIRFLNGLGDDTTHLFLLGDIFEFWIGDHSYWSEKFQTIVNRIHALSERGVEVHYIEGNHDISIGRAWPGVSVHTDFLDIRLGNKLFHLEHGDKFNSKDYGYLFLRWLLRSKGIRVMYKNISGSALWRVGTYLSEKNRKYPSQLEQSKREKIKQCCIEYAKEKLGEVSYDYMVMGHTHLEMEERLSGGACYINLGSWIESPRYGFYNSENFKMIFIDEKNF